MINRVLVWPLRRALLAAAVAANFSAMPAAAQDQSRPLTLNVSPSGLEAETAEERLERRLRQNDFLFRSICIQCGTADRNPSTAPFNPLDALGGAAPGRGVTPD